MPYIMRHIQFQTVYLLYQVYIIVYKPSLAANATPPVITLRAPKHVSLSPSGMLQGFDVDIAGGEKLGSGRDICQTHPRAIYMAYSWEHDKKRGLQHYY